jgi:small-conductance mechanosensitive channel
MRNLLGSPTFIKILLSLFAILAGILVTQLIKRLINRGIKDIKRQYEARKAIVYIMSLLSILAIVLIWVEGTWSVSTIIGFMGAGLTLALHQPVTSMAGWMLILIRRPYIHGDRIQIGETRGDVIDIRLFYTSILEIGNWVHADQSTGRIIHCPNNKIFTEPIFNYTSGFEYIWDEINVLVTFESDWRKARKIILEAAEKDAVDLGEQVRKKITRLSQKYMIHYTKLTPYVWTDIKDSGVELTLRYLTDARRRRATREAICEVLLDKFAGDADIDFAYPTYRIYKRNE